VKLLLATRNEGKVRELRELLAGTGIQLETLAAHPEVGEIDEKGQSFEDNAALKAAHAARASGMWAVGEDSGLEVDALDGAPGVRSARYAGVQGDDAANNARLLRELHGVAERGARYVCALALAGPDGDVVVGARGACEGRIATAPRGSGGFGYDPLFEPERLPQHTMAELAPEQKNAISHRGQALRAFLPLLRAQLAEAQAKAPASPRQAGAQRGEAERR
jgi:XTP/dITP diphosphohydrolase